jgi:hypothetical protein
MPLQQTSGNVTADAYGGGVAVVPNYIEDVFSTWLYTPATSNDPITISNGIDFASKGGMVWFKNRSVSQSHSLVDTVRGGTNLLTPNDTFEAYTASIITAFSSTGFTTGTSTFVTKAPDKYTAWSFAKAPKFFDVVTYTGTGSATTIAHNLGSVPGCIIVKMTSASGTNWTVYHRSLGNTTQIRLNTTEASTSSAIFWNNTSPTSTVFTVNTSSNVNESGATYVAYLFAHDAGGFGLTGTDNVISCGSYTGSSSDVSINLGYEAQWVLVKNVTRAGTNWQMLDIMRGMPLAGSAKTLAPNLSDAESSPTAPVIVPTATGVTITGGFGYAINYNGDAYIYIAIRRGPMKVPTDGTKVFEPAAYTGNGTNPRTVGSLQVTDLAINMNRNGAGDVPFWVDRLRGQERYLYSSGTAAEAGGLTGWLLGQSGQTINGIRNTSSTPYIDWLFRRAPSFFDEVCYTGTGSATTQAHNLGVVPEMVIIKDRTNASVAGPWNTWTTGFLISASNNEYVTLNTTNAKQDKSSSEFWGSSYPTASVFGIGNSIYVNETASKYVAYLFATCPGVSKVGSYTGTGATQTISCGFTGGARFVLIKKTSGTGDWYVWDTARGMVSGTDPSLLLNSTAAEVNANSIYTATGGFQIVSTAAGINASGGTYIYLSIA